MFVKRLVFTFFQPVSIFLESPTMCLSTEQHLVNSSCHVPRCSPSIRSTELGRKLLLYDRVHYPTIFPLAQHVFFFSLAHTHLYGDPSCQNIAGIPFCPDFASEVSCTRSAENRCSSAVAGR